MKTFREVQKELQGVCGPAFNGVPITKRQVSKFFGKQGNLYSALHGEAGSDLLAVRLFYSMSPAFLQLGETNGT